MSIGSPKFARREQAIEATRRRLRRLEIETHRIKAELARLEADYEDDVADRLSRKLRRRTPFSALDGIEQPSVAPIPLQVDRAGKPALLSFALEPDSQIAGEASKDVTEVSKLGHPQRRKDEASKRSPQPSAPLPAIVAATDSLSQSENSDRLSRIAFYASSSRPSLAPGRTISATSGSSTRCRARSAR